MVKLGYTKKINNVTLELTPEEACFVQALIGNVAESGMTRYAEVIYNKFKDAGFKIISNPRLCDIINVKNVQQVINVQMDHLEGKNV